MKPIAVGTRGVLEQVIEGAGLDLQVRTVDSPADARGERGTVDLIEAGSLQKARFGEIDAEHGRAALDAIEKACSLDVDGLVTGPINKEAARAGGLKFPGHTELLADLLGADPDGVFTMFVVGKLRIFFLTRNLSLRDAIKAAPLEMIGQLARAFPTPAPGKRLFIADLSGVEARGAARVVGDLRELEQCERIAKGLVEDQATRSMVEVRRGGIEQFLRGSWAQRSHADLWQVCREKRGLKFLSQGDDDQDMSCLDSPCDEGEDPHCRRVEPLHVVRDQDEWPVCAESVDEVESGKGHEEHLRRRPLAHPQCGT